MDKPKGPACIYSNLLRPRFLTVVSLHNEAGSRLKTPVHDPQWTSPLRVEPRVGAFRRTPWRNGTTHVVFEPLDFTAPAHPCARGISASMHVISRLVSLVPKPRVNLIRFHGVFAPNSKYRAWVTPARRGTFKSATQPMKSTKPRPKSGLRCHGHSD